MTDFDAYRFVALVAMFAAPWAGRSLARAMWRRRNRRGYTPTIDHLRPLAPLPNEED